MTSLHLRPGGDGVHVCVDVWEERKEGNHVSILMCM